MKRLEKLLAVLVLIAWVVFLLIDWRYQQTITPTGVWPQSESYGPLSFFQQLIKWLAFVVTVTLCGVVLRNRE